jgi:hypothetical protein
MLGWNILNLGGDGWIRQSFAWLYMPQFWSEGEELDS